MKKYRKLFSLPPWYEVEMAERGIMLTGQTMTAEGRAYVLDGIEMFCSDQVKRVVNTLHHHHRRVRLGPGLDSLEVQEGSCCVEVRR